MKAFKLGALALALFAAASASAQERYPSRVVTIVVPLTAGTTIDILARLFADNLSKRRRQSPPRRPTATPFCSPTPATRFSGP
jgi:tripartite-type tricarboxylate transporter receptor subunit TctC